jgi:hypothetical protein
VAGQPGPLWFGRGQCRRSLGPELLSAVAAPEGLAWRIDHPASSAPTARQAAEAEAPAGMILHSPPPHDHVGPARLAPCPEPAIELPLAAAHRRHVPHGTDRSPPDAPALRRAMLGLAARPPPYVRTDRGLLRSRLLLGRKHPPPIGGDHRTRRRRTQGRQRKGGVLGLPWRPKSILLHFSRNNGEGDGIVHKPSINGA